MEVEIQVWISEVICFVFEVFGCGVVVVVGKSGEILFVN